MRPLGNPLKLFNAKEISEALSRLVMAEEAHEGIEALLQSLYPESRFRFLGSGDYERDDGRILTLQGAELSPSFQAWMKNELERIGNAQDVCEIHKDKELIKTVIRGRTYVFTSAYGPNPEDFFQIEIKREQEFPHQKLFGYIQWGKPEDLYDLTSSFFHSAVDGDQVPLDPPAYRLGKLTNIRPFMRELAAVRRQKSDKPIHESRFLGDWASSKAGHSGHLFCDHWYLGLYDYVHQGDRQIGFTPRWSENDGGENLPEIQSNLDDNPFAVMAKLEDFDRLTGYPFSWYFYGLHGNRVCAYTLEVIAKAVQEGKIGLPAHDAEVLRRWFASRYGF